MKNQQPEYPTIYSIATDCLCSIIKRHEKIDPETGEVVEGRKWQQQNFFYIGIEFIYVEFISLDYKHFVDVVKYRLHKMEKKVTQAGSKTKYMSLNF